MYENFNQIPQEIHDSIKSTSQTGARLIDLPRYNQLKVSSKNLIGDVYEVLDFPCTLEEIQQAVKDVDARGWQYLQDEIDNLFDFGERDWL